MCSNLKQRLRGKNIEFEECNDVEEMLKKKLSSMPTLEVNGKLMVFIDAVNWLKGV